MAGRRNVTKNGIVLVADMRPSGFSAADDKDQILKLRQSISLVIKSKIFIESQDDVTIVSCGIQSNQGTFELQTSFPHVTVLDDLKPVSWDLVKKIQDIEGPLTNGDWMAAAISAVRLIHSRINEDGVKYEQTQVVFFSTHPHLLEVSSDMEGELISLLQMQKTELVIVGDTWEEKAANSKTDVVALVQKISGTICCYDDVLAHSVYFQKKSIKGTAWNVSLEIGNSISIPVSGYVKVKEDAHLKWQERTVSGDKVERRKTFRKGSDDSSATVDAEDVVYGYKYGSKFLTFTSDEEHGLKYQSGNKCLSLLAFVDEQGVPAHYYTGTNTMFFMAQCKGGMVDRNAQLGLTAFIGAMQEMAKVALVRRVYNNNGRVQIGVLSPRIRPDYQCLVYHELPFGDEYRLPFFPPLLTAHSTPTLEQLEAMDQLIDQFDLSAAGQAGEFAFDARETYDPHSQYLLHLVAFKALHPYDPLPDVPAHIKRLTEPPPVLLKKGRVSLERIAALFPAESDENDKIDETDHQEEDEPETCKRERSHNSSPDVPFKRSRIEVDRVEIGTETPLQDFQDSLRTSADRHLVFREMERVVADLLRESGGMKKPVMAKCRDCLAAYRQEAVSSGGQAVKSFNTWIRHLRQDLLAKKSVLHPFWSGFIIPFQLGLISDKESADSDVKVAETKTFLRPATPDELDDDFDDDMMQLPL